MRRWEYNKLITVVLVCLYKDLQNKQQSVDVTLFGNPLDLVFGLVSFFKISHSGIHLGSQELVECDYGFRSRSHKSYQKSIRS